MAALAGLGAVWAWLSYMLGALGVPAHGVWLPIDPARYYAWQAIFVAPWLAVLASLFAGVVHRLTQAQGRSYAAVWTLVVPAWAASLLFCFVVPDALVLLLRGPGELATAMRYYAPLAPAAVVATSARRLVVHHGVPPLRAVGAAFAGLMVQGIVGATILR